MFDFVKIKYTDSRIIPELAQNPLLDFTCDLSTSTGETKEDYCKKTNYKNISFAVYNQKNFYFRGSLHKYFNEGLHNYNNFSYSRFCKVLTDLKEKFSINPESCILQNLEIGLNIELPFNPSLILNNLLQYKGKEFINPMYANYYQCGQNRYYIKIYDKGKQYELKTHLLRFEVKYIKMKDLNDKGIYTLSDLMDIEKWNICKILLLEKWEHVLFYDSSLSEKRLTKKERKDLLSYKNPNYWRELTNRKQRHYHIKRYRELAEKHSENRHKIIRDLLYKNSDVLTDIFTHKSEENLNPKFGRFNTLNIELNRLNSLTLKQDKKTLKKCLVTKVDISMQKDESLLLSHTGLRYYLQTDKKLFDEIRNRYLPKKWKGSELETQIKELAHNIRNLKNNSKVRESQCIEKGQLSFYEIFN